MRGEITDSVPRFYNSIEKRSLKSCGFTVSRFKYEGGVLRAGPAMRDKSSVKQCVWDALNDGRDNGLIKVLSSLKKG